MPEVGVVVFAQDADKSRELWTQLIGLPAQFGARAGRSDGRNGDSRPARRRGTPIPDAPPIFVTQPGEDALVIGTAGAVESSLAAADAGENGPEATRLLSSPTPATSKAVFLQSAR